MQRASSIDGRLDHLAQHIDQRFEQVDRRFDRVDDSIRDLAMILVWAGVIIAALVGVLGTVAVGGV